MEKCKPLDHEWFHAVERGNLSHIQVLFKEVNDIDLRGSYTLNNTKHNNVTGLIIASHLGNKELVRWFLNNKADANAKTDLGWRPIHFAAKRGHVATIDMLCSNGAMVDPVTTSNDTPLSLALHSFMRDTVRKLIQLGVSVDRFHEGLLCHYVHRGLLPAEVLARTRNAPESPVNRSRLNHHSNSHILATDSTISLDGMDSTGRIDQQNSTGFAVAVYDSQVLMNQLQCQSTSYDLELARRKRELIRRLPSLPSLSPHATNSIIQQTQRVARADLPVYLRLRAARQVSHMLPMKSITGSRDENSRTSLGSATEPYLRLFEACMCESHCPSSLAIELSSLSIRMASLGSARHGEVNGVGYLEDGVTTVPQTITKASLIASYIARLLRKLISKNNPQYRAGILAHLCRMLSCSNELSNDADVVSGGQATIDFWPDLVQFSPYILSTLVRLGEALDQPINVARLAALIGLIGRRLIGVSPPNSLSSADRFSDLADILVGWGVDPTNITRGINLDSIYSELHHGLSSWWLHATDKTARSDALHGKSENTIPTLNHSIHQMMCHLLEDSENCMNSAVADCQALASNQPVPSGHGVKLSSDPTFQLISVDLYLSVLSSIIEGVLIQITPELRTHLPQALGLSVDDSLDWIERLLHLVKSAHTCYRFSWILWHPPHVSTNNSLRVSFSVVDRIECTVLRLLNCFLNSTIPPTIYGYLTNRLLDSSQLEMSHETLNVMLHLLRRIAVQCAADPNTHTAAIEVIHTCFGTRSVIHTCKFCSSSSHQREPLSKLVLKTLRSLATVDQLRNTLCHFAMLDLKLAIRFIKVAERKDGPTARDRFKCEELGLFSLALLSDIMRCSSSNTEKLEFRRHLAEVVIQECLMNWIDAPVRLRIAMLTLLNDESLFASLPPSDLMQLVLTFLRVQLISPIELNVLCSFVNTILDNVTLNSGNHCDILLNLCKLAKRILISRRPLLLWPTDPFVNCTRTIIAHAFSDGVAGKDALIRRLFTLSELALCHTSQERNKAGSDLLLSLSVSRGSSCLRTPVLPLGFIWHTTRRPDRSATALVSPPSTSSSPQSSGLIGSGSAYPSLPAVAGVLGYLTRGASYSATTNCSRLRILEEPFDWIRRLSHLICPIPVEMNSDFFVVNAEEVVLWYAAWTMMDYKLKVAPWVNPLKTFLSLEGTMRALLRPYTSDEIKALSLPNSTSVVHFHVASSLGLARQPWPRQLRQGQSLVTFIGFLERLIANATKGFAISLPRPVSSACTFFAANDSTCSQWFGRVRGLLLRIADDWPLFPAGNECSTGDAPASVLYHAYAPLSAVMKCNDTEVNAWLSGAMHHGISHEVVVRVAKALFRLSAWEEIQALYEWATYLLGSSTEGQNPFVWLEGLAFLARGHWDKAVESLHSFIHHCIQRERILQNIQSSETPWALGFVYVVEVLLQCFVDEGDLKSAFALRDLVKPAFDEPAKWSADEPIATTAASSSLEVSCKRLSCFEKLASWSSCTRSTESSDRITVDAIHRWSHEKLTTNFCSRLTNAAITIKSHHGNGLLLDSKAREHLSDLVNDIRQTSSAVLVSTCERLPCLSGLQGGVVSESGLCTWLIRADLLLDPPSQRLSDSELVDCQRNTVSESSWRHLFAHIGNQNARVNSSLQGCRWACERENFQLARRLLVRELEVLSFINGTDTTASSSMKNLHNVIRTSTFTDADNLSQIQRLLFSDCLAQLLWSSSDSTSTFNTKLAAIDTLSRGLRTAMLEEVTQDPTLHAARCRASVQVALRLFEWLEEPSERKRKTWAELINLQHTDNDCEYLPQIQSIVSHLNFFSRLVDEPWANGLPLVPSADLPPSSSGRPSSSFVQSSHSAWLSRLLMMATRLAPTGSSSAAWLRMANWCYTRGQTMVEQTRCSAKQLLSQPTGMIDAKPRLDSSLCPIFQPEDYQLIRTALEKHEIITNSTSVSVSDNEHATTDSIALVFAALITFLVPEQVTIESKDDLSGEEASLCRGSLPNLRLSKLCPDDESGQTLCDQLSRHLHQMLPDLFPDSSTISIELVQSLHGLIIGLTQRQYTLHTSAAQAYATFLTVAGQRTTSNALRSEEPISKLDTTTATLKLLDLLSCPSRALRNLIAGFLMHGEPASLSRNRTETVLGSHGPGATLGGPAIWEACLQQVLVRLSLPDKTIRNCLVALLSRLILTGSQTDEPISNTRWLSPSLRFAAHLVFPSVVAAMDSVDRPTNPASTSKDGISVHDVSHESSNRASDTCFIQIVSALQTAGFGNLVRQVETFVLELQRITLLWEELWLGSLLQHMDELAKKVTLLETEIKRTIQFNNFENQPSTETGLADKENEFSNACGFALTANSKPTVNLSSLQDVLRAKFVAVAQPTLDLLSRLMTLTLDVQPETPHEEWFQKTFGSTIRDLRETLLHPTELTDAKHPLTLIRQLICQLQTVHQSTKEIQANGVLYTDGEPRVGINVAKPSLSNVLYLSLNHLSPRLTLMNFGGSDSAASTTGIPLPGRPELESAHLINRVAILPTKTKPKRLLFRARNGQAYPYLLKGLEDLRLDDRIMRLFELINVALAHEKDVDHTQLSQMCARTYAITPLGVRAGLLQMVQGAVPLFSLYKRWQIRSSKMPGDNPDHCPAVVPRPGELFHARLKESLTSSGLPYQLHARNTWPIETLRDVFLSLESETPADLLSRELWASNPSCASWWSATRTFGRSVGLMSMLGYLVGLGDRHLDNLLTDLTTGHIIHIDYNVCFDKGRSLRVAERVPFRLTHILRHTLGPLAQDRLVRGTFRVAAEQTLNVARSVLDPVLIQLKAFLIDPLVDWQDKRQSANQMTITDFTHLGAYYGGGSSATRHHYWASCTRKQNRVLAEARMYACLLATRLHDLCRTTSLIDVCSALTTARSCFETWRMWQQASHNLSEAEQCYQLLTKCCPSDLEAAENRCKQSEAASDAVVRLRTSLCEELAAWKEESTRLYQVFSKLADPSWLPSISAMQAESGSELASALAQYYMLARVYLAHPDLCAADSRGWIESLSTLYTMLEEFLDSGESLDACLTHFSCEDPHTPVLSRDFDGQLITLLEQAVQRNREQVAFLQDNLQVHNISLSDEATNLGTLIRPEVDNLHLFVYDQGAFGVGAYCWALIDYLPGVVANILSLELDCDNEMSACVIGDSASTVAAAVASTNHLDQLSLFAEYVPALFSVLHHQPSGVFRFTAGFEADVRREVAFMYAVRDATLCLSQLRANLIHLLLLPETESALIDASSTGTPDELVEQFTGLVARYVTESDPVELKNRVNYFLLSDRAKLAPRDVRLHQVLLAVHLALTNTTAQMEEISMRVRDFTVTAPAWFYVDIIAQSASNMLARCTSWRNGATSLWGWESTNTTTTDSTRRATDPESNIRCSWIDEIYAMGLMAFVSVLEEGRAHWNAIRGTSTTPLQDLALNQFAEAIDRFMSRLISRIGLASLLGFAYGRLFCSLVEDTGIPIRRILMESEHNAKVAGVHNLVLQLSSAKLAETVGLHLTAVQPVGVQHLRNPASNLIRRLATHANQASERLCTTVRLELAKKHQDHLLRSLTAVKWISPGLQDTQQSGVNDDSVRDTDLSQLSCLSTVLSDLKRTIANAGESCHTNSANPSLVDIAKAICFAEELRTMGPKACSGYTNCLRLLNELKQALEEKENCVARLTPLDRTLIILKTKYELSWPATDWMNNRCLTIEGTHLKRTLRAQILADVKVAKLKSAEAKQQIVRVKDEMLALGDKGNIREQHPATSATSTIVPTAVMTRHATKRSGKHARSNVSPSSSGTLALSSSPTDSSFATVTKQSPLLSKLRTALTTLQSERLSEIRQLVKLLNRYELARRQLVVEGAVSGSSSVWSDWLDGHQSWTNLVLSTLKQLSKFLTQLSSNSRSGNTDEPCELDHAEFCAEAEVAEGLLRDCGVIHVSLWSALLEPLFVAVRQTVEPDENLSDLVRHLLAPVQAQIHEWVSVNSASAIALQPQAVQISHTSELCCPSETEWIEPPESAINQQALAVWYRTRDRFMGHDSMLKPFVAVNSSCTVTDQDSTSHTGAIGMPVSEQVDACICAATDIDNLALMYEGWTAWV